MKFKSLFLIVALLFSWTCFSADPKPHLTTLEGNNLYGEQLKGRWLIIHYWASWCDICISEMPEIQKFYQRLSAKKAQMFLVNYDQLSAAKQKQLLAKMGVTVPSLKGHPAKLFGIRDVSALPMTIIVNPQGKVAKVFVGPQSVNALEKIMN
jgi:thiol-disulfide isomerase/thioredoxin